MTGAINRPMPPTEQRIALTMPFEMWQAIRDLGRAHQRSGGGEIRAAISYWLEVHEIEKARTLAGEGNNNNDQG